MTALFGSLCALLGASLMLIAAIGIVRMPDFFTRMQAAAKASTLGLLFLVAATGLAFGTSTAGLRALLASLFFLITTPIAAHLLGRAAYLSGVRAWLVEDDLVGQYHPETHELASAPQSASTGDDTPLG